jgi:hypothetical protein
MSAIIEQVIELSKDDSTEAMLKMEALIEKELERNPHNIQLLLKFALLEQSVPFADHIKSTWILNVILTYEPNNQLALLILAGVNHYCGHAMDDKEIFEKLCSAETTNKEMASMLAYAASWYYEDIGDKEKLECILLKSIELCSRHVFNQKSLAKLYLKQNRLAEAKLLVQKAMTNVVKILKDDDWWDYTDANNYTNEMIKGTHITRVVYSVLTDLLQEITEKSKEYN